MIEIIKESWVEHNTDYYREFTLKTDHGCGFSFPCDENGVLCCVNPAAYDNYDRVVKDDRYIDNGIVARNWRFRHPAVGRCRCGQECDLVDQYMGAFECPKCGQWYNVCGQELLNPSEWEE